MRTELAHVAGAVCRSAQSRLERAPGSLDGSMVEALVAALRRDYGDLPAFADSDPGLLLEPDGRFAGVAEVHGLDDTSMSLLTTAVAPELDLNLGSGFALLSGSGTGRPTVALALELAGVPTASAAAPAALGAGAPLRRAHLLDVTGDVPFPRRVLRVPDRLAAHLAGDDAPDEVVRAMTVRAPSAEGPAAATVGRAVAAGAPLVWVRSPVGAAGAATAVAALEEVGLAALVVDAVRRPAGMALSAALAMAAREAALTGRGLVVTNAQLLDDPDDAGAARVLASAAVPVVAVGDRSWQPRWLAEPVLSVDAPVLRGQRLAALWLQQLPELGAAGEALHLRLAPEDVVATAQHARLLAAARGEPLDVHIVRDAARVTGGGSDGQVAMRLPAVRARLDDLVLPRPLLDELRRLLSWATHREAVLARGQVQGKGGKAAGITAMFSGGPGTGKTLAAHVVADELDMELVQVDLSAVVDKYIGETEKNLERIFVHAESRNVVLFFDEADALFGTRSEVRDARDRYANQEVSYLLQRMEHYDGITLLATNLHGNLDAAFMRRMQFVVHFPDPDAPTRVRLWEQHLAEVGGTDPADPVDVQLLAVEVELTGGDIRNIVLSATYDAVSVGAAVGMRHVRSATVREYRKLGRRVPSGLDLS